ncbi:MAG: DUF3122 domain-containing protein [Coleofasciculus sp. C1-SOL-03]|uniref:DUF3122 domain-containing protein n=1 Tax=Coleofasciculus sp. C1-SOL-03 TaxID=3069522 RepID=UPI0032F0F10C
MVHPIQRYFSLLLTLGRFLLVLLLFQATVLTPPAVAVLRQHQDAPGIMRYHSQESLKDVSGRTWQVVLFKKIIPGQPTHLNLRLVGFPGIAEFTHPQFLEIATAGGKLLTAPDVFAQEAPAPNVGQYDVTDVFAQLQADESLTLSIPLKQGQPLSLTIPQSLVIEWQLLVTEIL